MKLALALAAALMLTGCSAATSQPAADEDAVAPFAIDADFPDPDVLKVGDEYHLYATNGAGFNIQHAVSTDLMDWEVVSADVLPTLPDWASPGKTWAPEVTEVADGRFVMYVTVANTSPSAQCIGVAVAEKPEGPFVPVGDAPLVCPTDDGGAIDASTFRDDDGVLYLLFKNDGNCCGKDTWLQIAPLSDDGLALAGEPTRLLKQTESWEGDLIEAPTLVKRGDTYLLLYSANGYGGPEYATGYATATSVLGPYTKGEQPLLTTDGSDGRYLGPGGQDVVVGPDGDDYLVFHSWDDLYIQRGVSVVPMTFTDGVPAVELPE